MVNLSGLGLPRDMVVSVSGELKQRQAYFQLQRWRRCSPAGGERRWKWWPRVWCGGRGIGLLRWDQSADRVDDERI